MRWIPLTLLMIAFASCWEDLPTEEYLFNYISYQNSYLEVDDAILEFYTAEGIECPDSESAKFFLLYSPSASTPAPFCILLHGGVLDYLQEDGRYYSGKDKLNVDWATDKVWETLAITGTSTDGENNKGTVPAALLNHGFYILIPANCWADLWHGDGFNDLQADGFYRLGKSFIFYLLQWIDSNSTFVDWDRVMLWGLGMGAHGVSEIPFYSVSENVREYADRIDWVVMDSPFDLLSVITDYSTMEGIKRIFGGESSIDYQNLEQFSIYYQVEYGGFRKPIAYIYSEQDLVTPIAVSEPAAVAIDDNYNPTDRYLLNVDEPGHVYTNADYDLASGIVEFLLSH